MKIVFVALALSTFVTGCAFNPQKVTLAPSPASSSSTLGSGITVAVKVNDERPKQSLGRRGSGYGPAAEITSSEDVASVVRNALIKGLEQKGFSTSVSTANQSIKLTVDLRLLEYSTSMGMWTGGVQIQAAAKATAVNKDATFEKLYRSDKEERVVVVPTAETNQEWINARLSDLLTQILNDPELLAVLSKK